MKGQKTNRLQRGTAGFTLVEMIGVLAIIALLAGMLIPRIMEAIRSARVSSTAVSINTLRAAVAQYMTKHNTLGTAGTENYDSILVGDGDLEKAFEARIGTSSDVVLTAGSTAANGGPADAEDNATTPERYDLDGNGSDYETLNASVIVEAVIQGVPERYARALSVAIDGEGFSADIGSDDSVGRVVYDTPGDSDNGATDVYVYIAHD